MKKTQFKKQLRDAIVDHGYWSNEVNQINDEGQKAVGYNNWLKWHDEVRAELMIFEVKQKTDCANLLDTKYEVGQEVALTNGKKAKVVQILNLGHSDIRPPFHMKGCLVLESTEFLGRVTVVPNSWSTNSGEINERKLK